MRLRLCLLLVPLCIALAPAALFAYDVLVVQDQHSLTYDTILKGFHDTANFRERRVVLQDSADNDLIRIVREERPSLVVAVGGKALAEARRLRQVPVVSVFSYSLHPGGVPPNLVRLRMLPPPARYAALFRALGAKRVATLLSSSNSAFAAEAAEAFRQAGIRLIIRTTERPEEVPRQLEALKGSCDSIWLLPDATLINSTAVEAVATFSMQQKLPFVSYSEAHLRRGAVAVFTPDLASLGGQAAETTRQILGGNRDSVPADIYPIRLQLRYNGSILGHFNLSPQPLQRLGGTDAPH